MYFGGYKQTQANMNIVFPSILPLLSNVEMLTVGLTDGIMTNNAMHKLQVQYTWNATLSNEAFTPFLGSPSLTTLVISKFGFPGLLSKCMHVKSLQVRYIDMEFESGRSTPDQCPRISSLSCGASLPTVRYLIPGFLLRSQGNEKDIVDLSALRQLTLIPEFNYPENMTQDLINYFADRLEDLDCGAFVFPSPKLKPMPHLRTLKRWIHLLPGNNPTEQILNQLCDILNHCTTTSKVIQHITINLAVVRLSFEELIRLDWSYVDDIFENPPPTLRELTLGIRYKRKTFEGKPVLLGDLQTALRSVMERRMPHLTTMASSKPHIFKFSFVAVN